VGIEQLLLAGEWTAPFAGPRYIQLRNQIEAGIADGVLKPGAVLPSERSIAEITGLSRVTVRKAMSGLVSRGAIVQKQGSGSFVTEPTGPVVQSLSLLTSFTDDMRRRNLEVTSTILSSGVSLSSPEEVVALALSPHDRVSRIVRLRLAGGQPMAIENASIPVEVLSNPETVTGSLYDVLAEAGNRPVRALQKLRAINVGPEDASLLGVEPKAAGLKIERIGYAASGRPVEFTRSLFRGDVYDFVAELTSMVMPSADPNGNPPA